MYKVCSPGVQFCKHLTQIIVKRITYVSCTSYKTAFRLFSSPQYCWMFVSEAGRQRWDGHMMGWSQEIIFNCFFFVLVWSTRGWAGSQVPLPDSRRVRKWRHQALDWNNLPVCKCLQRSSTWGTAPAALCFHLSPLLWTLSLGLGMLYCLFNCCASTFCSWCMVML